MKKNDVGAFNDLFKNISAALLNLKTCFCIFIPQNDTTICTSCDTCSDKCFNNYLYCKSNAWLKRPHNDMPNIVVSVDTFMWINFWIDSFWLDSEFNSDWKTFCEKGAKKINPLTNVYMRCKTDLSPNPLGYYSLEHLPDYKSNPLSNGKIADHYIGRIRDTDNFDEELIAYATWYLYNEFYSEDKGNEQGIMVPPSENNNGDYYKASYILWTEYFKFFNDPNIKMDKNDDSEFAGLDSAQKLIEHCKLTGDINYKEKCDEAANLFWSQVRTALKTLEVKPITPCIFTIGGNTMNTPTYDAFAIFNSNPVYQKCRAVLMEDQPLVESGNPGKVMENCSSAELLSYLSFFNTLANFEDKDIQVFCTYLGDDFARAVNNPTVQKEVFFKNHEMLSGLTGLYLRYILRVYMNEKYEADAAHSSEHEFLKKIPLIRFSLNDSAAVHEFIKKNEATVTIHKYGDCYGTFRLRYADESDIDNILSMQNADGSDNKSIFIRAGEAEIRRALLNRQLFVVEDMHKDVDINAKATKSNNGKSKSETENPLAAFAILCPDILPYSETGEAGTANYNGKIIEKLEALGYSRNDYSSFNTNFVAKDYRGYGLQRLFLRLLSELSANAGKSGVVCTVSANNEVSYNNFGCAGYEKESDVNYVFDGVEYHRDFLMLRLK